MNRILSLVRVGSIIIFGITVILVIMYFYPLMIERMKFHYILHWNFEHSAEDGTFGDMYGALNSFLSGVAILGIVLTLYLEAKHKNEDIAREAKEQDELEKSKLRYLANLIKLSLKATKGLQTNLMEMKPVKDYSDLPAWKIDIDFENIRLINKIINQEEYFLIYRRQFKSSEILDVFATCRYIEELENRTKSILISENDKCHRRKIQCYEYCISSIQELLKFDNDPNQWYKLKITLENLFLNRTFNSICDEYCSVVEEINKVKPVPIYSTYIAQVKESKELNDKINFNILTSIVNDVQQIEGSLTTLTKEDNRFPGLFNVDKKKPH